MNTLKIEIPKGFVIDTFDQKTGEIKFKARQKSAMDIITDDDVFSDHGITREQFESQCAGMDNDVVAFLFLRMVAASLNEGWVPDHDNGNQYKYQPYFYGGSSGFQFYDFAAWLSHSYVGSRLCFKSRELAEHAGKNFTRWYKQLIIFK